MTHHSTNANLTDDGKQALDRVDAALREEVGRRLPSATTAELCHTAAFIAVQAMAEQLRVWRDENAVKDTVDAVAEILFDAAHEHCEEECAGGGMLFWRELVGKLIDPGSPEVAIAFERWALREEIAQEPAAEVGDDDGWLRTLDACLYGVKRAHEPEDGDPLPAVRKELVELGAWVAEWIAALDRARDAELAKLAGGA